MPRQPHNHLDDERPHNHLDDEDDEDNEDNELPRGGLRFVRLVAVLVLTDLARRGGCVEKQVGEKTIVGPHGCIVKRVGKKTMARGPHD